MELMISGKPLSVKNLEDLLKRKENRGGETVSPQSGNPQKLTLNLSKLSNRTRELFLKELNALKRKYGIVE